MGWLWKGQVTKQSVQRVQSFLCNFIQLLWIRPRIGEGRLFGSVLSVVISGAGEIIPSNFYFLFGVPQNFYSEHLSLFIIKKSLKNEKKKTQAV